jgi:hypothetical protein
MAELLVQYSTSTAFASGIIRRLTHSRWSHVDLILEGEGLLGVSGEGGYVSGAGVKYNDPGGVIIRPFNAWPYLATPKIAKLQVSEQAVRDTIGFARSQLGKPFDGGALWGFLQDPTTASMSRNWREPEKWYCSELIVRAAEIGGCFPYHLVITKDRVSPGDSLLIFNPLMTPDNIAEFIPYLAAGE